jgi:beta-galactosidase
VNFKVTVDNDSRQSAVVRVATDIFLLDPDGTQTGKAVTRIDGVDLQVASGASAVTEGKVAVLNPRLWGPPPTQQPNRYVAITTVSQDGKVLDRYETRFGIREVRFDPNQGISVNGERVRIQGVNQHHDLGALGAAWNQRAAQRQLEILREMGCNAVRMSHNPPASELLELCDQMGFLVVDEIFDVWARRKTPLDFHLIFPEWSEPDTRAFIRRDRNHPSVILWSVGNEIGEQYTGDDGAVVAKQLHDFAKEEDPTRPTMTAMNYAKPNMPLPKVMDVVALNYQGEGIRDTPAHAGMGGIRTPPQYPAFHEAFPDKVVISSESAAALSSRGTYLFPVTDAFSAPVKNGLGGDAAKRYVSAYELHAADFGSTADKVFAAQDKNPFVAGEFVWSGWDYLGEPTPYYSSRSSYFGIIDLAGFKKDRFYLYQSRWRPELPMAHILPHWTWPERVGEVTPVHVFTSGDEAELFLNGESLGRQSKAPYQYRLRWDYVEYEPGELAVVAYKDGKEWARTSVQTAGPAARLALAVDRPRIAADGRDLAFVTARVVDAEGRLAPRASNLLSFQVQGAGELVATDNGDPTSFVPFASPERAAFNGLALAIVRGVPGKPGDIRVRAGSPGLQPAEVRIRTLSR